MRWKTLNLPKKNTSAIGMYIKPESSALMQISLFLELKNFISLFEKSCEREPRACGRLPNKPSCILFALRKTANAEKKDSPKPTISE